MNRLLWSEYTVEVDSKLMVAPSQERTYRGYGLLVRNVKSLEEKLTQLDVGDLATYFREVNSLGLTLSSSYISVYSYRKEQEVLEVMIQPTSNQLSSVGLVNYLILAITILPFCPTTNQKEASNIHSQENCFVQ